jgi:tetratricopeptide (TPR) repeat protein
MSEELEYLAERYRRAPDSRLFAPLADAYRKSGEIDQAISLLEKGLEKFPRYASAHVILGKCFYDRGATERSKGEFARVLEIDGENMVALKFMGDILFAEDRRDEAAEYFRRIIAIDPMNEEVARALKDMEESVVMKETDLGEEQPARKGSPRELATMTLAAIYAAQGYHSKAIKIFREILTREPGNREAKEMISKLQSMMDSTEVERNKAFRNEALGVSLSNVDRGIISNTAGRGSGPGETRREAPPVHGSGREEHGEPAGEAALSQGPDGSPGIPSPPESERAQADAPREERAERDVENFRSWLDSKKPKGT